ncbi:MAG TPA: RHS repeat-associated core domain-containing protein [Saprospiraceae bacterium]|nr:RHS repeat-associated core domain-containing protein [Saprospiraceae bacterium]HMQ81987.1 RHS repeat-associated core domain-containing protein [Saprospiraceae bacterium]
MDGRPQLVRYDYGARWYDPAVGRFGGVDPLAEDFAQVSTYNYAENEPIANIDLHGLQKYPAHKAQLFRQKYPQTTAFLQGGGLTRMASSPDIQNGQAVVNLELKF